MAPVDQQPTPSATPEHGGTLRVGMAASGFDGVQNEIYVDPAFGTRGYFMRCCLARTLLTYPGESTIDGGTVLLPDLAEEMPEVARDGMSWTFRLRRGINYAPPNQSIDVTSVDFVYAAERALRLVGGDLIPPFSFVAGAAEYAAGEAATISGLEAPDPYTLVIRLTRPYGAFDWVADPVWAPIPASVAEGHDEDFARFWPSTGPYMYETYPANPGQLPAVLVRNPQWDATTDPRRPAYADRIEISLVGEDRVAALGHVERGEVDFVDRPVPAEQARAYRADPAAAVRLRTTTGENLFRLPMNLAVPPFDDVAVRRAVMFAVDRRSVSEALAAGRATGSAPQAPIVLSKHAFPDSITAGLLIGYDPLPGQGAPDLTRARAEMSASRYDADHDGVCDAIECSGIRMPAFDLAAGQAIRDSLATIGVIVEPEADVPFESGIGVARTRTAIDAISYGWFFELTGSELALLVRGGPRMADEGGTVANTSLVGASPEQLAGWGYEVTSVPSVDDVVDRCEREVGRRRAACWAELDQLVTENVAPWVPLFSFESPYLSSSRVADFSLDQSLPFQFPALDKVIIVPGL